MGKRIGFISFRFAGTDGVSLETEKWAHVLKEDGHECFYFGGELDTPEDKSMLVEITHFKHPVIRELNSRIFDHTIRKRSLTDQIHEIRDEIKDRLYDFVNQFKLDMIIPENILAIPINIPFALAVTEFIAETGIPVIGHHHDFFWERKRFLRNNVWEYLNCAFPPHLSSMHHVVINSSAQNQLALRTGISSTLIPNVMHFESPPPGPDEYTKTLRDDLGLEKDELLFLQPTRVVQRKGIEHAIELAARMDRKCALVISHASGDEGYEYQNRVKDFVKLMNVRAIFVDDIISDKRRSIKEDGRKVYKLEDVYHYADIVTYPSVFEGFGNAFLEAIYYKRPVFVNNYSIYHFDIKPKGFKAIEMDDFVCDDTVSKINKVLDDKDLQDHMAEKNYRLGLRYYSYSVVKRSLNHIMETIWGCK